MPRYEYHCEANQQRVVVRHCKSQTISTWGQLCQTGQVQADDTALDASVTQVQQLACGNGTVYAQGECCGSKHHDDCHDDHAH